MLFLVTIIVCGSAEIRIPNPQNFEGVASFVLSDFENGTTNNVSLNSTDNLIFAELYSDNSMWIRIAEEKEAKGENGPHLDIDLCGYQGSGKYSAIDPQLRPCKESGWDLWWHGKTKIFLNTANADACELQLTVHGDTIAGRFECREMIEFKGTSLIGIKEGSFETLIQRK